MMSVNIIITRNMIATCIPVIFIFLLLQLFCGVYLYKVFSCVSCWYTAHSLILGENLLSKDQTFVIHASLCVLKNSFWHFLISYSLREIPKFLLIANKTNLWDVGRQQVTLKSWCVSWTLISCDGNIHNHSIWTQLYAR